MDKQEYKRSDMIPVGRVCQMIPGKDGGPCSRQHIYNLIEKGCLAPAFRFGGRSNIHVPRQVVQDYIDSCRIDPGK